MKISVFSIFSCLFLLSPALVFSQQLSHSVRMSAGNIGTTPSGHSFSWSMGETFTSTLSSSSLTFTQGFQQLFYVLGCTNESACNYDTLATLDDGSCVLPALSYFVDADNDGFGVGLSSFYCINPGIGYSAQGGDCNDNVSTIYAGAPEICNGIDEDCNGTADDGLTFVNYFLDADGDTFGAGLTSTPNSISQGFDDINLALSSGWSVNNLSNPIGIQPYFQGNTSVFSSYNGAANSYIGVNFNSGSGTSNISNWLFTPEVQLVNGAQFTFYARTTDLVSYADRLQVRLSTNGASTNVGTTDASVGDFTTVLVDINPDLTLSGFPSVWTQYTVTISGITNGSTGRFAFRYFVTNAGPLGINSDYIGIDNVNYSTPSITVSTCNGAPAGFVANNTDCNDYAPTVYPGATELCNNIDENCDTQIDEGVQNNYYVDTDADGYGAGTATAACTAPTGMVANNTDCNDNISTIFPGASEICNGVDEDCDGNADDGLTFTTYFLDSDGDNFGTSVVSYSETLIDENFDDVNVPLSAGWSTNNLSNPIGIQPYFQGNTSVFSSYNGAANSYIGVNFNSGSGTSNISNWLFTPEVQLVNGAQFTFYARTTDMVAYADRLQLRLSTNGASTNVGTTDASVGDFTTVLVDINPNLTLSGFPNVWTQYTVTISNITSGSTGRFAFRYFVTNAGPLGINSDYIGIDNVSYLIPSSSVTTCNGAPLGYVDNNTDCNDGNILINPGVSEICNANDEDCDALVDEGVQIVYYIDSDNDNFGAGDGMNACTTPVGYVSTNSDCDNSNSAVNPGATEVCNSIDDDCDTQIDEGVGSEYYTDADGDGYGTGTATIACAAPVGMVANNTDCNDSSSAVNPGSTETCNLIDDDCDGTVDDGVPVINYYSDLDGDTFGGTLITSTCAALTGNFVVIGGDCDDANISVNPGAVEICINSIDDDCDGNINGGCLPDQLAGESPATSQYVWTNYFPTCVTQSHTLAGFAPSLSSQSICLTGEDKWHYFTATSEAVSIVVASSANDILLELQNASGTLVATENAVSGLGGEILNFSGLVSGQVYKVGVRNYNSALGIGAYTICVKMLKRGGCDYGPGPYNLCQYFKATFAGTGAVYTFTFTGLTGNAAGNVYTRTQSSDICVLSNVSPSLPYGSTYNVLITSTYNLLDGAGNTEVIAVPALSPCTMSTVTQPTTSLRTADQCINGAKFRGAIVASLPWVCGVTNWRWEFTEVNPITLTTVGLPIALNRGAASNYINLGTVSALQHGKTYAVRTAPILASTGSNYQWGPTYYMCIIGSAGMVLEDNNATSQNIKTDVANEVNMSLYPNPTHGTDVNINLSGVESDNVQIRIVDAMGRQVWSNRFVVNGVLNTNITFEQPLSNGLYFVEAIFNGEVQTQRLMIQK